MRGSTPTDREERTSVQGMEQVERKAADMGESGVMKTLDPPPKIALVPFVQGDDPRVHLLDGDGKASSAR